MQARWVVELPDGRKLEFIDTKSALGHVPSLDIGLWAYAEALAEEQPHYKATRARAKVTDPTGKSPEEAFMVLIGRRKDGTEVELLMLTSEEFMYVVGASEKTLERMKRESDFLQAISEEIMNSPEAWERVEFILPEE